MAEGGKKTNRQRKQKLIYELEVKDKMRKIQINQQKQKEAEDKQRLNIGKNLFQQIMAGRKDLGEVPQNDSEAKTVSFGPDSNDNSKGATIKHTDSL